MDTENLIRMANRIGDFFEAMPDRDEALEGIALHLRKFWEPRMRRQFLEAVEQHPDELHEVVRQALARHGAMLRPEAPQPGR